MNTNIRQISILTWSATGTTAKITGHLGKYLAQELHLPCRSIDFTPLDNRRRIFSFPSDELVIVGSPTYAGKLPNKILPDFREKLSGGGALAIPVVTFGNRSFDNSLAELCSVLETNGFHTIAGAAFACRHAFSDQIMPMRPDAEDLHQAEEFASQILRLLRNSAVIPAPVQVTGDAEASYYIPRGIDGNPAKFLKAKPVTDPALCDNCGLCAEVCPVQSIDHADHSTVPGICIKCHACIRKCPAHAKYFDDPAFLSHVAMLEANYTAPQENKFFFSEYPG